MKSERDIFDVHMYQNWDNKLSNQVNYPFHSRMKILTLIPVQNRIQFSIRDEICLQVEG